MKNFIALLFTLLMTACLSFAQENSANSETVRGCLSTSNGAYTLTGQNGVTYMLSGKADLSQHVGHEIEVSGQRSTGESSAASPGTTTPTTDGTSTASENTSEYPAGSASRKSSANAGPNAAPEFQVTQVKMISDHCAASAGNAPQ